MADDMHECVVNTADDTYLKPTFYEQFVEHVFVSEVLQKCGTVLGRLPRCCDREIDAFGYDLVFDCNGVEWHVQLKTSKHDAKASGQKVNVALAEKPYGCVVWIFRHEGQGTKRMILTYRLFECGKARKPPQSLGGFKVAKHAKRNAQGNRRKERQFESAEERVQGDSRHPRTCQISLGCRGTSWAEWDRT